MLREAVLEAAREAAQEVMSELTREPMPETTLEAVPGAVPETTRLVLRITSRTVGELLARCPLLMVLRMCDGPDTAAKLEYTAAYMRAAQHPAPVLNGLGRLPLLLVPADGLASVLGKVASTSVQWLEVDIATVDAAQALVRFAAAQPLLALAITCRWPDSAAADCVAAVTAAVGRAKKLRSLRLINAGGALLTALASAVNAHTRLARIDVDSFAKCEPSSADARAVLEFCKAVALAPSLSSFSMSDADNLSALFAKPPAELEHARIICDNDYLLVFFRDKADSFCELAKNGAYAASAAAAAADNADCMSGNVPEASAFTSAFTQICAVSASRQPVAAAVYMVRRQDGEDTLLATAVLAALAKKSRHRQALCEFRDTFSLMLRDWHIYKVDIRRIRAAFAHAVLRVCGRFDWLSENSPTASCPMAGRINLLKRHQGGRLAPCLDLVVCSQEAPAGFLRFVCTDGFVHCPQYLAKNRSRTVAELIGHFANAGDTLVTVTVPWSKKAICECFRMSPPESCKFRNRRWRESHPDDEAFFDEICGCLAGLEMSAGREFYAVIIDAIDGGYTLKTG